MWGRWRLTRRRTAEERAGYGFSLAQKLSLLAGSVIACCLIAVLAATYGVLARSAVSTMQARLTTSTQQLASLVQSGLRQNLPRYLAIAHDSTLRRVLVMGVSKQRGRAARDDEPNLAAVRALLAKLPLPNDSTLRIELWNATGRRVVQLELDTADTRSATAWSAAPSMPAALREAIVLAGIKDSLQLSRLYVDQGRVVFWIVHPVIEHGAAQGYIAQLRRLGQNAQTDQGTRALVGEGVNTYYANSDGTVWTSLGGRPAPAQSLTSSAPAGANSNVRRLTASAPIVGTPLVLVMQSELDYVLGPARSTIEELSVAGLAILLLGMLAALLIGRRMVGPIVMIAEAAEAMGRGQYDVRVSAVRETELARLADSFNYMADQVAAAAHARREVAHMGRVAAVAELASSITHELRQPLTAILANADSALLLLHRSRPALEQARECVQSIIADCNRAADVISHIHVLLRKEERITTSVDLNQVCREAVHLLQQDAALRRTQVELELARRPLRVVGDPVQLQQVLINLTLNALDAASAMRRARKVTVSTSALEGAAQISVRDTGPGVNVDLQERLFEPFFTTKSDGLGMGLAIVRSIVARHHGRVVAENDGAAGAVFKVSLPLVAEPAPGHANVALGRTRPSFGVSALGETDRESGERSYPHHR